MAVTAGSASDAADAPLAIVLSGAAGRGAFQAGVLAELLPTLEREGTFPSIILGTSAGSINAMLWASMAHLDADDAGRRITTIWEDMGHSRVFEPIVGSSLRATSRFASGALLGLGRGTTSLLDTEPLRRTAHEFFNRDTFDANIERGRPDVVGVVATRLPAPEGNQADATGRSVMFLQGTPPRPYAGDPLNGHDVVAARLGVEHVMASAAIPVAFPPQRIEEPPQDAGWYVDGGVRHNTPLLPAIVMGARRVIVVSATPTSYDPAPLAPDTSREPPDIAETTSQVLGAMLSDRVAEDLVTVRRANGTLPPIEVERDADGHYDPSNRGMGPIRYQAIAPEAGELGRLAAEAANRLRGRSVLGGIDNLLLRRAIRGAGSATSGQRELLSYFLFDPNYFAASIEHGREAARRALARGWLT